MKMLKYIGLGLLLFRAIKQRIPDVKKYLKNAFSFEIKNIYGFDVYWDYNEVRFKIDLAVKNNLNIPITLPEGAVVFERLDVFYQGRKVGSADLKNVTLNFEPGETKLITGINARLTLDYKTLYQIYKDWPVSFDYTVYLKALGNPYQFSGTYKI